MDGVKSGVREDTRTGRASIRHPTAALIPAAFTCRGPAPAYTFFMLGNDVVVDSLGSVLVVDSDMGSRHRAMAVLLTAGYAMSIAEHQFEALKLADREHPDLVVLGASMTDGEGLSLVGRLFSNSSTATTPVLVIANTTEQIDAANRSGARAVLPGPVSSEDLLQAIDRHINSPGAISGAPMAVLVDADRRAAIEALRPGPEGDLTLDRFTTLAAKLLHAPVSLITLIDIEGQLIASQMGRSEPGTAPTLVPLTHSFCQFAVTSKQPLRIDDSRAHPLVASNLAIDADDVKAYLGMPLILQGDNAVGALCVYDSSPREWTDNESTILSDLTDILIAELDSTMSRGRPAA
jgi:DNA-binding response OmpR family regulator